MPRTLILYATTEGQTARIAERISQTLRQKGHEVDVQRAVAGGTGPDPANYEGVIVGAAIHYGKHPRFLRTFVRRHREALAARPSAFYSVSLSAGGPNPKPKAAQRYLDKFLRRTGWRPRQAVSMAGALQFSKYGPIKRRVMLIFVTLGGGDTDTSKDYEYTDWSEVARFADAFAQRLVRG